MTGRFDPARALADAMARCPLVAILRAVLPASVPVFAVGGIGLSNIGEWARAGASGAGLGSALYRPGDDVAQIARRARDFADAAQCVLASGERN